ncbi:hypothetical protein [Nostoc flagelliforme]|nr:hypothetical protein [Nostoc flagelliforme]
MKYKRSIYLSPGCILNLITKKIVINVSSEDILNLIMPAIKNRYLPGTQQEGFEPDLKFPPDFSTSQILQLRENVAEAKPDTLVVVSCQIGEAEVDELELKLPIVVYLVMGDTKGVNHFLVVKIQLSADIWSGEERFIDLEEQLGDKFFKDYEIQLTFDNETQTRVEFEVLQTLNMPARLEFLPEFKKFSPTVDLPTLRSI